MRPIRIENLTLQTPLMLAPMAGFTHLPFRAAIRSLGGLSLTTTELVHARALLELNPKSISLIAACSSDRPIGVQLLGADIKEMRNAARFLRDLGIDFIDINLGCPSDKVNRAGGGAALLRNEALAVDLAGEVVEAVDAPVTVKMRLGWDDDSINAHVLAPRLEQAGVAAVVIHGRTRMQGYAGAVNLDGIRAVARAVKNIPVIGNGDVRGCHDAQRMLAYAECDAVMVGRAALKDPFFFRKTSDFFETGAEPIPATPLMRLLFMHLHFALALRYLGEEQACVCFRRIVAACAGGLSGKQKWRARFQRLCSKEEYYLWTRQWALETDPGAMRDYYDLDIRDANCILTYLQMRLNKQGSPNTGNFMDAKNFKDNKTC